MTPPRDQQGELLPCPFCGGQPSLESGHAMYDKTMEGDLYFAEVTCANQILCTARIGMILNNEDAARQGVIRQWNTRALTAHDEALPKAEMFKTPPSAEWPERHANDDGPDFIGSSDEALPGDWTVEEDAEGSWHVLANDKSFADCGDKFTADSIAAAHNSALRLLVDALRIGLDALRKLDLKPMNCRYYIRTLEEALQPYSTQQLSAQSRATEQKEQQHGSD